jgi:hypothetical protein
MQTSNASDESRASKFFMVFMITVNILFASLAAAAAL